MNEGVVNANLKLGIGGEFTPPHFVLFCSWLLISSPVLANMGPIRSPLLGYFPDNSSPPELFWIREGGLAKDYYQYNLMKCNFFL
jgi:hypothetical protein